MSSKLKKKRKFNPKGYEDRLEKQRQAEIDERMKQLIAEGYSFKEAETIIGNEELMRYE